MVDSDLVVAYIMGMWTVGMAITLDMQWRLHRLCKKFKESVQQPEEVQ